MAIYSDENIKKIVKLSHHKFSTPSPKSRRYLYAKYTAHIVGLLKKEPITFRKPFRIAIRFLIGFVICTTCGHMHCKRRPNHEQDLCTAR